MGNEHITDKWLENGVFTTFEVMQAIKTLPKLPTIKLANGCECWNPNRTHSLTG